MDDRPAPLRMRRLVEALCVASLLCGLSVVVIGLSHKKLNPEHPHSLFALSRSLVHAGLHPVADRHLIEPAPQAGG